MSKTLTFPAIVAEQSPDHTVFTFCARASEVYAMAQIDRIGRESDGSLKGFQRPQIANHIVEIRKYLSQSDAILPNPIVLAFTDHVSIDGAKSGASSVTIDISKGPPGFVVDGQQRLTALGGLVDKDFQLFISGVLCKNEDELRKQFILINNTRPLPKTLIYELLPSVSGLPSKLSDRAQAAALVERLNFDETSSLRGQIKQHTNPKGVISDTALQRLIMNSYLDGAMRELSRDSDGEKRVFELISNFFAAVQGTFAREWRDHSPRTSRLVHGAGVVSMGYVMEFLWSADNAYTKDAFCAGLTPLVGRCSWTSGNWDYGPENIRPWNSIQNLARDWVELSEHLIRIIKNARANDFVQNSESTAA
jgi:DGQHR domain-containing protein